MGNTTYNTLEEIQLRRDQLNEEIERDSDQIATLWSDLFKKNEDATRGEQIATLITNSITAIDAFLLARKLIRSYSSVFSFFKKKGNKRRH